jgi:hypothetical protein
MNEVTLTLTESEIAVIRDCIANATVPVAAASQIHIPLIVKIEKQLSDASLKTQD